MLRAMLMHVLNDAIMTSTVTSAGKDMNINSLTCITCIETYSGAPISKYLYTQIILKNINYTVCNPCSVHLLHNKS